MLFSLSPHRKIVMATGRQILAEPSETQWNRLQEACAKHSYGLVTRIDQQLELNQAVLLPGSGASNGKSSARRQG